MPNKGKYVIKIGSEIIGAILRLFFEINKNDKS